MSSEDKEPLREQGCWVCTGPEVELGMWLVHERALLWVGNGALAGEPFRLTVGSPVPVAALTGPAGVAALGRHISKLLDQGAEEFAGL